jgi:glycosyltransferase involved in cell wall biosynthesis
MSSERPLRLLVVLGELHENGGVRVDLELARQWNAAGASARVFALRAARGPAASVDSTVSVRNGCRSQSRIRYAWPLILLRLIRGSRDSEVVISGSEIGLALIFAFVAAHFTGRRFATIVHSSLQGAMDSWTPLGLHSLTRFVHRHTDATSCVSQRLVPELLAVGVRPQTIRVIPNGIDADRVRKLAQQPPRLCISHDITVVAIGRLSPEKGFDVLIKAHALVRQMGLEHRLVIIGEGPARSELLQLACALGVGDTIDMPGFQANPFPELAAADLFCMPSRYEGFPIALLEALALGVPIVASSCGGELLADGAYGDLVAIDSVDGLARAIERHLRSPTRLRATARLGPARARLYAWPQIADEYLRFLSGAQPG